MHITLVAVLSLLLSGCSALAVVNAVSPAPRSAVQVVSYGDSERQKIDVYRPVAAETAAGNTDAFSSRKPMVVFFYGGSWNSGSRSDYSFVAEALNSLGYAVAIPDYRLTPEVLYPDFLTDSANAVRILMRRASEFGADPERIILMGHSAGAYNAAMLSFDRRWLSNEERQKIKGFVGLAAPTNFLPIQIPTVRRTFHWPNTPRDTQPIEHIAPGAPPTLLISARRDLLVSPEANAYPFIQKLRVAGVPAELEILDGFGLGHASLVATLSPAFSFLAPTLARVQRFIDQVVR